MGPLSKLDNAFASFEPEALQRIGSNVDPGRTDLGKAMAIGDPLGLPFLGVASGNLAPFGTPTEKGVSNPLAVSGVTDVAHDKGAEIAALIAAGSFLGGLGGAESAGAGFDPGGEGLFAGETVSGGFNIGEGMADSGEIMTDASPEVGDPDAALVNNQPVSGDPDAPFASTGPDTTEADFKEGLKNDINREALAPSWKDGVMKSIGISPTTAALLGISGIQAFSKPQIPEASKTLSNQAGPGAAQASATIQSGGTSTPAWTQQKSSIDAAMDQQLKEQTAAMTQQAINSGQGADSQLTLQQIDKLKNQIENQRQQLYAQAQAQNVQAALQQLGISDQALANVAGIQYQADAKAKAQAASTAELALLLQANSKS